MLDHRRKSRYFESVALTGQFTFTPTKPRAALEDELALGWYPLPPRGKYRHHMVTSLKFVRLKTTPTPGQLDFSTIQSPSGSPVGTNTRMKNGRC